jgi:hypothetical protein
MTKLVINETQFNKIKELISEQSDNNKTYIGKNINFDIYFSKNSIYKGLPIEDIVTDKTNIYFKINIDENRYGIDNINIYDIKGPNKIYINVTVFDQNIDDTKNFDYLLNINWDPNIIQKNNVYDKGDSIGIGQNIKLYLDCDGENFTITSIEIDVMEL